MATSYSSPITVIHEISEDEKGQLKSQDEGSAAERTHRRSRSSQEAMSTTKANISKERERERERSKRYHRSTPSGSSGANRHTSSRKTKNTSAKRSSVVREREHEHDPEGRSRHRRSHSNRSRDISSSSSSSSEEEAPAYNHRIVLSSARARLTSPSTISNLTSLTNTTNKSSSSSGSNSTVTQASITKRTTVEKKSDLPQGPMSPAVPDAPNVFAYLDPEGSAAASRVDLESNEFDAIPKWEPGQLTGTRVESSLPTHMLQVHAGSSSSASSSFHGDDNSSEAAHDVDTDRSTSPERSNHEEDEEFEQEEDEEEHPEMESTPIDDTSAKIASQMAAAQQRQSYHGQMHYGTPDMQRGPANLPHIPSTALSTRPQQQIKQHPLPRAEKLPVTGYELLASQLSSRATSSATESGEKIKPIYRKFEALNHRLLLHLQDELSELEEQLHRLDHTDTQSRRTETHITPASRRASEAAGGELQWHKTDILGKIGYKLAQYSKFPPQYLFFPTNNFTDQALASFNSTRSLTPANPEDVTSYRTYLQTAHPITESETHFLDPEDDLISIFSEQMPSSSSYTTSQDSSVSSYAPSVTVESKSTTNPPTEPVDNEHEPQHVQAFAAALAVSILVPILTFSVIPGILGRITASSLVVGGVLAVLMQGGLVDRNMLLRSEGMLCAGIYGGVMIVVAGLF